MRNCRIVASAIIVLLLAGCSGGSDSTTAEAAPFQAYNYVAPSDLADGWATGHLDDHGFDSAQIAGMMTRVANGEFGNIDAVTIVRNNTLVLYEPLRTTLDEYDAWVNNTELPRHVLHSTSKAVTSALVGIALDQGYIQSTEVPFYSLFNYTSYDAWDPKKAEMTLGDALTMRLGLEWDEWSDPYGEPENDLQILTSKNTDYAKALLDLPVESEPGTTYVYNTAATIAIGQALENSVGVPLTEFAGTHLFAPLQIMSAAWGTTPSGLPNGGSGLFLAPRDMVKFGQLFISGGIWNGQQVISEDWIEESLQRHVDLSWTWTSGYGYQWWRDNFSFNEASLDSWSTRGFGGQYIFCVPSLELVVAFTSSNYGTDAAENPMILMQDYILPALEGSH